MERENHNKISPPQYPLRGGESFFRNENIVNLDNEQKEVILKIGRDLRKFQLLKRLRKVEPLLKPAPSLISGMKVRRGCKPTPGYQKYIDELCFQRKIARGLWKFLRVSHMNDKTFWGMFGG